MNLNISVFLDYDGDTLEIEGLLSELGDVFVKYDLGNFSDPDSAVRSLIFLKSVDGDNFDLEEEILNSYAVVMPMNEGEQVE